MIPELLRLHFDRDRIERIPQKLLPLGDRERMKVWPPLVAVQKPEWVAEYDADGSYRLIAAKAKHTGVSRDELPRVIRAMLHGIV